MKTNRTSYAARPVLRLTYANVVSTLAVLLLLVGGGAAVAGVAKNSVTSKSVKNNSLTAKDLKDGVAVASSDVVDDSLTGTDIDESTFSTSPTGPAGGALTGTYPDPSLATGSVTSSELGTITLRAATLSVPAGQWGDVIASCNPGEVALSGGAQSGSSLMPLLRSRRGMSAQTWVVQAFNGAAEARALEAFVTCLAP